MALLPRQGSQETGRLVRGQSRRQQRPWQLRYPPWRTSAGTTVFAPFKEDTSYFGDRRLQWMINFRVRDLDKMVAQLRERGIAVEVHSEVYPNGRFARLSDPEGNPIQLWQPGGKDPR